MTQQSLVIFTTRNISRSNDSDRAFLFKIKHKQKGTEIPIYRFPGQLLFAADALPDDTIQEEEAVRFVNQVVENVWKLLSEKEKKAIQHVKLILHRKELGDDTNTYKIIRKGKLIMALLDKLKATLGTQIQLAPEKPTEEEKDNFYVEFVAFSHDPNHFIKDILCKPEEVGLT